MKRPSRGGFTIVEVLIAIVMLSIGVLAMASSSGAITRMMNFGRMKTNATAIGQSVLDSLRYEAQATTPKCTALGNGTLPPARGFSTSVNVLTNGNSRDITVTVNYQIGSQAKSEVLTTSLFCL
jgi:prepilin-type N-terminal cleavage/methylation domain-containing protein